MKMLTKDLQKVSKKKWDCDKNDSKRKQLHKTKEHSA